MAIDRNKVTAAAQKYIQKGAYKKAIKEYKKIIASKPDDVRILLKIGDIQARDGQSETAARTYTEVADHYVAHGFFLKAVAAYKLLLGADAENVEAKLRLADLYFQLGLLRDALTNYQAVAAVFNERGWVDRYLQTLQKVVDIDPDHAGNRIKFAEELARFDQEVGAAEQFMIAAAALRREGRFEDFTKVMERYVHLSPDDVVAVHDLCRIYLQQNRAKRALVRIQAAFKADPRNEDTVEILVSALDALGERDRAVQVLRELANNYTNEGSKQAADATYRRLLQYVPDDEEAMTALGIAPAGAPLGAGAPLMTFDVIEGPAGGDQAPEVDEGEVEKLLSETDVYLKYNLCEKALDHLQKVFELDPQNVEGMERRKTALIATGQDALAVSVLIGLSRIVQPTDQVRAMTYLHQALSMAPGDPAVVAVMTELGGVVPEGEFMVTEATVVETPASQVETAPVSVRAATATSNDIAPSPPLPPASPTPDGSFDKLDELFDEFAKEDTAGGHQVLSDEVARAESGVTDTNLILLDSDEILPAALAEGLEEVDKQLEAGAIEDARMGLFELLGEFPEYAVLLLRRMDALPVESVAEPELAASTVGAADDLFLSDSVLPSEETEDAAFANTLPPLMPPKLSGSVTPAPESLMEFEVFEPLEEPASEPEPELAVESPAGLGAPIEFEALEPEPAQSASEPADDPIGESGELDRIQSAVREALASQLLERDESREEAVVSGGPPDGEGSAGQAGTALPESDALAASSGSSRRLLVTPLPSALVPGGSLSITDVGAPTAAELPAQAEPEPPVPLTPAFNPSSDASDAVAAALEGDGIEVREDAIKEAERLQSGDYKTARADPFGAVQTLMDSADAEATEESSASETVAVEVEVPDSVAPGDEGTEDVEVVPDQTWGAHKSATEDASDEPEAVADLDETVADPDEDSASEGTSDDAAAEAVADDDDSAEIDALEEMEELGELSADDAVGDEIEITDFDDDDDDIEFEDIDDSGFDDVEEAESTDLSAEDHAEDAAHAAEARENEVDALIGRPSSYVTLTFSPGDAVVADDGGSDLSEAIVLRRSGGGMAAMFDLQTAADGPHALAVGFELALANIEMGLYFEGIAALEQQLRNMDLARNDRLLVHYHLGVAYEAMDQQPLAEANFRVVAASAPDMFPDVFLRLERMKD